MDVSMQLTKKRQTDKMRGQAEEITEERILDILAGPTSTSKSSTNSSRESFHEMLRDGILDSHEVEVEVPIESDKSGMFTVGGSDNNPNVVAVTDFLSRVASGRNNRGGAQTERKKMTVKEARQVILDIELERLLENIDLKKEAVHAVEESGIVFIDEIDKICSSRDHSSKSADASAEGVQRDLLPLVEGTTISTKYGNVDTDYMLFIGSGAFHAVKPSDMLPELQGRLPIRVELNGLTEEDLYKILTEPEANLVTQQIELIKTEGVSLAFNDDALREIAKLAAHLNRTVENIGARRLHTVMERIMEEISFKAAEMETEEEVEVTKELVKERLADILT